MLSYKFINRPTKIASKQHGNINAERKPKRVKAAVLGVRSSDDRYYKADASGRFQCRDESAWIQFSRVNDDFCDCLSDGSDEPGTDACPNGR